MDDESTTPTRSVEPGAERQHGATTFPIDHLVRTVLVVLLSIPVALVLLDLVVVYGSVTEIEAVRKMFNLSREQSVGTWVSSGQFLVAGIIIWLIRVQVQVKHQPRSSWEARAWGLLALFFFYFSLDDALEIHERLHEVLAAFLAKHEGLPGASSLAAAIRRVVASFPSHPWLIFMGPIFALMGLFMFLFLWHAFMERALRWYLLVGLGCYAVALGLDFVEGLEDRQRLIGQLLFLSHATATHLLKSLEEFLELIGTSLLLVGFLKHFLLNLGEFHICIARGSG